MNLKLTKTDSGLHSLHSNWSSVSGRLSKSRSTSEPTHFKKGRFFFFLNRGSSAPMCRLLSFFFDLNRFRLDHPSTMSRPVGTYFLLILSLFLLPQIDLKAQGYSACENVQGPARYSSFASTPSTISFVSTSLWGDLDFPDINDNDDGAALNSYTIRHSNGEEFTVEFVRLITGYFEYTVTSGNPPPGTNGASTKVDMIFYKKDDGDGDGVTCDLDCDDDNSGISTITDWYRDNDGDQYAEYISGCIDLSNEGYVNDITTISGLSSTTEFDCDDSDPMVNPGANETIGDGIDNDCNPLTRDFEQDTPINSDSDCGQVLSLDGVNDHIRVNDSNDLDLVSSYTIEAWIYPKAFTALDGIVSKYQGTGGNANGYFLRLTATSPYTGLTFDGLNTENGVLSANQWYHVAAVNNNGTRALYINGASIPLTGESTTVLANTSFMGIGVDFNERYFNGLIDEVKIWNRALSAVEVSESASNSTLGDEATSLVAHYDFNNGVGSSTLIDLTEGNNGTLTNMDINSVWLKADGTNPANIYYTDADNDGYVGEGILACEAPDAGYYLESELAGANKQLGDCDDDDPARNPGNTEIEGNGIDDDCDESTQDVVVPGNTLNFDGSNDYVRIEDNNALDLTSTYTIEAWIKADAFKRLGGIVSKYQANGADGYFLRLSATSPYNKIDFDGMTSSAQLENGTWYHVAAVNNSGSRSLYINGVATTLSGTPITVKSNDSFLGIGLDFLPDNNRYFDGQIDEVRIWNVARSAVEINAKMDCELEGSEAGLVAYYNFNQGIVGTNNNEERTLTDATANGLDGDLISFGMTGTTSNWTDGSPVTSICANEVPVLSAIGSQTVTIGEELVFTASATDADSPTLTYSLDAASESEGMTIGSTSGAFSWTPGSGQAGDYEVTITVSDEENSDAETFTITVNKIIQEITFNALAPVTFGDAPFSLSATGGASGNPVTFTSSDQDVATVDGSTVNIVGVGETTITANQAGNENYHAADPVAQTLTVNEADQTISQRFKEVLKAVASDGASSDLYAWSVSISGDHAIIGVRWEDEDALGVNTISNAGAAYIFERDASTGDWNEVQKLVASDRAANDDFGLSVSISGDYAIIGAHSEDEDALGINTSNSAGSAYIFERDSETGSWVEVQKLVASDRAANDDFGWSVSISGDYAIVGAYLEDEDVSGTNRLSTAGSAYIFERDTQTGAWTEVQKLVALDRSEAAQFGFSVFILGDRAVIGAHYALDTDRVLASGAAYIFEKDASTGDWAEVQKLVASDPGQQDQFGYSVAISGDYALIGAAFEDEDASGMNTLGSAGSAYIFARDSETGNWAEVQKIVPSERAVADQFGVSVSISGDYAVVGANLEDEDASGMNTIGAAGSAYIFTRDESTGNWGEVQKLVASDRAGDFFGTVVALNNSDLIIGAPQKNSSQGAAYIFELVEVVKWTGATNSDWNTPENWESNTVPTSSDYVVIAPSSNDPVIAGDFAVNDIAIESGATLTISTSGNLEVLGTASGTGSAIVEYAVVGDNAYSVLGTTVSGTDLNNLNTTPDFLFGFDGFIDAYFEPTSLINGVGYFKAFAASDPSYFLAGSLNSEDYSVSVTYTDNSTADDFELLANPYNAPIYHSALVDATDGVLDGVIYLWQDGGSNLPNGTRAGSYEIVNAAGTSTGSFDGLLDKGQGFFVNAVSSGTVTFSLTLHHDPSSGSARYASTNQLIKLSLEGENSKDVLVITYEEGSTHGKDVGTDAIKFMNPDISFFSMLGEEKLGIQTLPQEDNVITNLGYSVSEAGTYKLTVSDLSEGVNAVLIDNATKTGYTLTSDLSLELVLEKNSSADRLTLINEPVGASTVLGTSDPSSDLKIYGNQREQTILFTSDGTQSVTIYTLSGKVIYDESVLFVNGSAEIKAPLRNEQLYILRVGNDALKFLVK